MSRFSIEAMPGRKIVHVVMRGLFSPDDAAGLIQAYTDLLDRMKYAPGTFDLLVDVSESPIQPADIVQTLSNIVAGAGHQPARVAFVHGDNVARLQARRVSADLAGRHFATVAQALEWLG